MKYVLTIIFLLCGVLRVSAQTLPTITTQPKNLALNPGDTGALTVAATSTGAVSYRWFKNGAAMADGSGITGTLTATLSFASALTTDTGNYYVVVSNSAGSVTSSTAALTVAINTAPTITSAASLDIQLADTINFAIVATYSPTSYTALGLPSGLVVNPKTGVITGTTTVVGTYAIVLSATNSIGTGTQNFVLTVVAQLVSYAGLTGRNLVTTTADGSVLAGQLSSPTNLAADSAGNVYVTDAGNHTVAKVTPAGGLSIIAGQLGKGGGSDGLGSAASFLSPGGIACDSTGNLYVADTGNHTIRKITPAGIVSTLAGSIGVAGNTDGIGSAARFFLPQGIAVDAAGIVYVADTGSHTVRKITAAGVVTTLAGLPELAGSDDGTAAAARFSSPNSLAVDGAGTLYVADGGNNSIRKITSAGIVSKLQTVNAPNGIAIDSTGKLYGSGSDGIWGLANTRYMKPCFMPTISAWIPRTPVVSAPRGFGCDLLGNFFWFNTKSADVGGFSQSKGLFVATPFSTIHISTAPQDQTAVTGSSFQFSVGASGQDLKYAWFYGTSSNVFSTGPKLNLEAYMQAQLSSRSYKYANDGIYTVIVYNAGSHVTLTANLSILPPPPKIITQPSSLALVAGQTATFSVLAYNETLSPMTYIWSFNNLIIPGATGDSYTIKNAQAADVGSYSVQITFSAYSYGQTLSHSVTNSTVSAPAILSIIPPVAPIISAQPQSLSLKVGASGTLSVTATGAPDPTYQWKKDGVAITGATSTTYTLSSVATKDAGDYTVVVSNSAGSAISNSATLSVTSTVIPPAITTQPGSLTVISGAPASMSVVASGTAPLAYQWSLDGSTISGANSTSYTLPAAASRDAGSYTCVITNSAGSVTSTAAILTVNTAPTITAQPANQTVIAGSTTTLSVTATGNPAVTYQWRKDGVNLSGATSNALSLSNVTSANAGSYTCVITNTVGSITSNSATLTVNPSSALANLSVRTTMATGQTLIVGAVVRGGSKNVLIRAGGPALNQFGLAGMTDPNLEVYASGNALVAANNDWPATLKTTFASVGAFPFVDGSKDSALIQAFEGSFTALARGIGPGALLIEAYDTTSGTAVRLINVSARNQVGTGGDVLIAGFVINGTGTKQLLIRGVGPGLGQFGVTGFLADPKIQVYDSKNAEVASNDNWTASLATTFSSVGAFNLPANSKDAALLVTLAAGASYTVIVSGADGGTGDGIVEIYEVAP
jgi:sugar lactone lactonase YvrE